MSWFRRLLRSLAKPIEGKRFDSPLAIEFDPSLVSEGVEANLRRNIEALDDIGKKHLEQIYKVALRSVLAGRDEHLLYTALMKIQGISKKRAVGIARLLNNKATEQINREKTLSLGITHAIWMYANAPCMKDPRHPTEADMQQDAAHKAADGKKYEIRMGLFVDGKWTRPGVEDGCKCSPRPILPWSTN